MSQANMDARYTEILRQMTLEEKAGLLSGKNNWQTKNIDRLGLGSLFCADGPHGLRVQLGSADHLGLNPSAPSTCFPTAAAVACSWDPNLGERIGRALGEEARTLGVHVLLGPGLNIKRNPLCGRNFEYFSEDPYLSGKLAAGYVRGIQSQGVAACPKHFAANSQETLRMHNDSVLDERTLRELYLAGFEIVVRESAPRTLMTAYNRVGGVYANEHPHLLRDILVDEWGFDGIVISDWGGSNDHVDGVIAGSHLEMPAPGPASDLDLVDAVRAGRLSEAMLNRRVEEFLRVALPLLDQRVAGPIEISNKPSAVAEDRIESHRQRDAGPNKEDWIDRHHQLACQAARESIVLLRNEGNILPLRTGLSVALIGDFAQTPRYQGAGSSFVNTTRLEDTLELARERKLPLIGFAQGFRRDGQPDTALCDEALALAGRADIVLLYLGLDEGKESEGMDRTDMKLADNQVELLSRMAEINPNIVVVLSGGAAIEMPWLTHCKGLVYAALSGQAGAGAVLDVLTGVYNPGGKLTETYPLTYADVPSQRYFPGRQRTSEYRDGLYVGYRYYEKAGVPVRFPFGFGMSYTKFAYSDLTIGDKEVTFTLTNTGSRAGAEIAQLYIGRKEGVVHRPVKELRGFAKVQLQPDESKTVTISLDDKAFRYFNTITGRFEIEGGRYDIYVGASSADIRLTGHIDVAGTLDTHPDTRDALPHYHIGAVSEISDEEFAALLGRPIPDGSWDITAPLERNDTFAQLYYAKSPVGRLFCRVLQRQIRRSAARGKPDLNIHFIYNMTFRGLAKLMAGAVDLAMADAIVYLFNGHFFRGVGRLLGAWRQKGKRARMWGGKSS